MTSMFSAIVHSLSEVRSSNTQMTVIRFILGYRNNNAIMTVRDAVDGDSDQNIKKSNQ